MLLHTLMRVGMSSFIKTKQKRMKKQKSKNLSHKGENPPARTSVVLGIIKLITQHTVAAVVS